MAVNKQESFHFRKVMRGYEPEKVDACIENLVEYIKELKKENDLLQKEIARLREQERYVQSALIVAEKTAAQIQEEAEKKRAEILEQAQKEAEGYLKDAEMEINTYRSEIRKRFYGCKHTLKDIANAFSAQAMQYMQRLEEDLKEKIDNALSSLDIIELPLPESEVPSQEEKEKTA